MDDGKILLGILALAAAYQLWVSVKVVRAPQLETLQKLLQVALVWLIPVIGAIIVQTMLAVEGKPSHKPEKGYTEPLESSGNDHGT
jgi:hypothetical protein